MSCKHSKVLAAAALAATLFACQPDADPTRLAGPIVASRSGRPATEVLASPAWQATAATQVALAKVNAQVATGAYALVGVGQYWAVQRAEAGSDARDGERGESDNDNERGGRNRRDADRGAVAGASVVVLTYLFPGQTQALEDLVTAERGVGSPRSQRAFARGEAIGRT